MKKKRIKKHSLKKAIYYTIDILIKLMAKNQRHFSLLMSSLHQQEAGLENGLGRVRVCPHQLRSCPSADRHAQLHARVRD